MQDYVVLKASPVLLDPRGFQGLQDLQVLVFQALRGYKDLKEIRDILVTQEFQDDQALQVRDLVEFRDSQLALMLPFPH